MLKNRIAVCVLALAAVPACAMQDATQAAEPEGVEGDVGIERAELMRRLEAEGPTPELVALARRFDQRLALTNGEFYRTSLGPDHDLMLIEGEGGGFVIAERMGPEAADEFMDTTLDLLNSVTPSRVFNFYRPGEEVPAEIIAAEARMTAKLQAGIQYTGDESAQEDSGIEVPAEALVEKHAGDATHFRDAFHNINGQSSKGCEDSTPDTKSKLCWLNRTSGAFSQFKSTHARYHFGLVRGTTRFVLSQNGSTKIDQTVLQGEFWRFTSTGPWHCPGFLCSYYGFGAITHRGAFDGSNRSWHMGARYEDILRRD